MAYTPELSEKSSCTLRRLAWGWAIPMTKAIERVMEHIVQSIDREEICERCRDKSKCKNCAFNNITVKTKEEVP